MAKFAPLHRLTDGELVFVSPADILYFEEIDGGTNIVLKQTYGPQNDLVTLKVAESAIFMRNEMEAN